MDVVNNKAAGAAGASYGNRAGGMRMTLSRFNRGYQGNEIVCVLVLLHFWDYFAALGCKITI